MDEYVTKRAVQDLLAKYYATANIKQEHILRHVNMDLKELPAEDVVPRCSGAEDGRLIYADKLKAHYAWWNNEEQRTFDQIVDAQPTVDAVPVVRCRGCKHFQLDAWSTVNGVPLIVAHEVCDLWAGGCKTSPNGYCSYGERKDGVDNG